VDKFSGLLTGALIAAAVSAGPAFADAGKTGEQRKTTVRAEYSSVGTQAPADDLACASARRKLWVEGEGWIVRRVTVCR
jgi:hypothetical protein